MDKIIIISVVLIIGIIICFKKKMWLLGGLFCLLLLFVIFGLAGIAHMINVMK